MLSSFSITLYNDYIEENTVGMRLLYNLTYAVIALQNN